MSQRARIQEQVLSPLGLHMAAVVVLAGLTLGLGIRLALDWSALHGRSIDEFHDKQAELKTLELQTAPLLGLDARVDKSRKQIAAFYDLRIPPHYSSIAERLGEVAAKGPVQLTRVQYTQGKLNGDLTEIRMDAGLSGNYPAIMRFVNGLERDKTFFVIRAMALTGQQGGLVNLRLRVSTWLKPDEAAAGGLPPAKDDTGVDSGADSGSSTVEEQ